ncbi:MAG: S16 family serine protease, partial [Pseudomonadota bacterium]|nr:S16 family serine protease [Pseudomonadota bacterium]
AGMEGTRPLLVEIQALISPSPLGTPRRTVVGWDSGRLAMVLAVLETRCGLPTAGNDVYLNVAGGLRVGEPAADFAVAAALVSALTGEPVPSDTAVFGEIGLTGEVRPVGQTEPRIREASKLGFSRVWMPKSVGKSNVKNDKNGKVAAARSEFSHLTELMPLFHATTNAPRRR